MTYIGCHGDNNMTYLCHHRNNSIVYLGCHGDNSMTYLGCHGDDWHLCEGQSCSWAQVLVAFVRSFLYLITSNAVDLVSWNKVRGTDNS